MKEKNKKILKKMVIASLAGIILLFIAALIIIPVKMTGSIVNTHITYKTQENPEKFGLKPKKIFLETEDKLKIVAYDVEVKNPKAVIIMISGIQNPSVTYYFNHASLFAENKYATVLFETRAHGESEGEVIGLGYKEVLDVKAVTEYIKKTYPNKPIVVFGVSMGGAIAINSIGQNIDIKGLISMSAFSSWKDVMYDSILKMNAPKSYATIQKPFVNFYTLFKYGFKTKDNEAYKQIKNLGDRPALIVHSRGDSQVPFESFNRIIRNAPSQIETWILEGDKHMIIENEDLNAPENKEYVDKVMNFLEKNFK